MIVIWSVECARQRRIVTRSFKARAQARAYALKIVAEDPDVPVATLWRITHPGSAQEALAAAYDMPGGGWWATREYAGLVKRKLP